MVFKYEDIETTLDQLFVLDYIFRADLKTKLPTLGDEQLQKLRITLKEILHIQQQKIYQKIAAHPEVAEELLAVAKIADSAILASYKDALAVGDKAKIDELTKNINNL